MDHSLPGSSVHGTLQARILEWVAIPFSRGSSWPKDGTQVSCIAGRFFTSWATGEAFCKGPETKYLWLFYYHTTDDHRLSSQTTLVVSARVSEGPRSRRVLCSGPHRLRSQGPPRCRLWGQSHLWARPGGWQSSVLVAVGLRVPFPGWLSAAGPFSSFQALSVSALLWHLLLFDSLWIPLAPAETRVI